MCLFFVTYLCFLFFFLNDRATIKIYTYSPLFPYPALFRARRVGKQCRSVGVAPVRAVEPGLAAIFGVTGGGGFHECQPVRRDHLRSIGAGAVEQQPAHPPPIVEPHVAQRAAALCPRAVELQERTRYPVGPDQPLGRAGATGGGARPG